MGVQLVLQNLCEAAAVFAKCFAHEVDNCFLLVGCLQSQRAIFAENRNMQLCGDR